MFLNHATSFKLQVAGFKFQGAGLAHAVMLFANILLRIGSVHHHPRRLVAALHATILRGWWWTEQAQLTKYPEFNLVGW